MIDSFYQSSKKEGNRNTTVETDEGKYKTLFEQVNVSVFLIELSGDIIEANVKSYEMFEYQFGEIETLNITDLLSPSLNFDERMEEIISHGGTTFEAKGIRKNKSSFPVEINTSLFSMNNNPTILILLTDITEQKNKEQKLREQELKYRRLFESTTDGMIILDSRGEITDVNQKTLHMLGLTRKEMIDQNLLNLGVLSEKALSVLLDQFEWLINKKQPSSREVQLICNDGNSFDIELSSFFLFKQDNEIDLFVVIIRDLREQCRFEKELEKTKTVLHLLLKHTNHAVYYKNAANQFRLVNSLAADLFEKVPEEMIGKSEYDFLPSETAQRFAEYDKEVLRSGTAVINGEQQLQLPYGIKKNVEMTKIPHVDETGNIVGLLSIIKLLTPTRPL